MWPDSLQKSNLFGEGDVLNQFRQYYSVERSVAGDKMAVGVDVAA